MSETISRRVTASGYEEAMHLAIVAWIENWGRGQGGVTRALRAITIAESADPGWRMVRKHLRTDFAVIFEFDASPVK